MAAAFCLLLTVQNALAYDISVTVQHPTGSYATNAHIYVTATGPSGVLGTSMPFNSGAVTTVSIHGATNGTYLVEAFLDTVGNGIRHYHDPATPLAYASLTYVNVVSADAAVPAPITLSSPGLVVGQPTKVVAYPGTGSAVIEWEPARSAEGYEFATHYKVEWATDAGFTTNLGASPMLAPRDAHLYFADGLTPSTPYYFRVTPYVDFGTLQTGTPTLANSGNPLNIVPTGSTTVSGTVTLGAGVPSTGNLFIALVSPNGNGNKIAVKIPGPHTSPVGYSVSGVSEGEYRLIAFIDSNDNGSIDTGEYMNRFEAAPRITVKSGTVTGSTGITLDARNVDANAIVQYTKAPSQSSGDYSLMFDVQASGKMPVGVIMRNNAGTQLPLSPLDVGVSRYYPGFFLYVPLTAAPIAATEAYLAEVTYSDDTIDTNIPFAVLSPLPGDNFLPAIVSAPPHQSMVAPGTSPYPEFSWNQSADGTEQTYSFNLYGFDPATSDYMSWDLEEIPKAASGPTSIVFGDTALPSSEPPAGSLTPGFFYEWSLGANIANGNRAMLVRRQFYYGLGGSISGMVKDQADQPVSGALVEISDLAQRVPAMQTATLTDGSYSFSGIPATYYEITASAAGYVQGTMTTPLVPENSSTTASIITLTTQTSGAPGAIAGTVSPPGATIELFDSNNNPVASTSEAAGSYSFTNVAPGTYFVRFSVAGYTTQFFNGMPVLGQATPVYVTSGSTTNNINATLYPDTSPNSIQGRVTGGASVLQGVTVKLYAADGTTLLNTTTTNASGDFAFNNLGSGDFRIFYAPGSGYQSAWHPFTINLPALGLPPYIANATLDVLVTLGSAGITHRVLGSGNVIDTIDAVVNGATATLGGMTLTVTGPDGFFYSFADADIKPHVNNTLLVYKEYTSLAPGVYTFTLNDGIGNIGHRVDTHVTVTNNIPPVDSATIQRQRNSDDSYRFSWAPVNDTRTYSYRLRIERNDGSGVPVHISTRTMASFIDVPAGVMTDGAAYRARVEATDSSSYDLVTSRSDSAYLPFTPQIGDYDPNRFMLNYVSANTQVEADGTQVTAFGFSFGNTAAASAVTSAVLTGPNGFSYTYQPGDLLQPNGVDFYKSFASPPAAGTYEFSVEANGIVYKAYATLTPAVAYPAPDPATYQAERLGNGNIRFSWADVDHSGALYYRVQVKDAVTGQYFTTQRLNQTYAELALSALGDLANKQWRVEVYDSPSPTTQRNRRNGPWKSAPLAYQAYDVGRPSMGDHGIRSLTTSAGGGAAEAWAVPPSDVDGTIADLRVDGPNGYSRNLLTQGWASNGAYLLADTVSPAAGLYTFTVTDNAGNSVVRYNYQPVPHAIPAVDYRTLRLNTEPNGNIRFSWAPVVSDVPLWYYIEFWNQNNLNISEPSANSSVVIPSSWLQGQVMFRVKAIDGSNNAVSNNASQSVMLGYAGPGFDYASLMDSDNDGFASNVEAADNDPAINPFSGLVVSTSYGSTGNGTFTCNDTACAPSYPDGTIVSIQAIPGAGSTFTGWSGACSGSANPCSVTASGTTSVFATFRAANTLGAVPGEGNLSITMEDDGRIGIFRFVGGKWQEQVFSWDNKGSLLYINGVAHSFGYFSGSGAAPVLDTANTGRIGDTRYRNVWTTASGATVTQTITYEPGSTSYNLQWDIANTGATDLSGIRFFHGQDTYFFGDDLGAGFWNAVNTTVGVEKNVTINSVTSLHRMSLQGVTAPYRFESQFYDTVYDNVNAFALTNTLNINQGTDNGYALEWRLPSLSSGASWSIVANEKFADVAVSGGVSVTAPVSASCAPGAPCPLNFTVTNTGTSAEIISLSASSDPSAWAATPESASITVEAGASRQVSVTLTSESTAATGTIGHVTLVANATASDTATVTINVPLGAIAGKVTDGTSGLFGIDVIVSDAGGNTVGAISDFNGDYFVPNLAAGSYTVRFLPTGNVWKEQYYNNRPDAASADLVTVTPPATTVLADAILVPTSLKIVVTPASYDFGTVPVGGSASWPITVTNSGAQVLTLDTAPTISGTDYTLNTDGGANPCGGAYPKTLAPGASCTVTATLAPTATGSMSATLSIFSNDPVTPATNISLTGTGVIGSASNGSIVINNFAAFTTSSNVTLSLATSDANVTQMQFSNDGSTWSALEPFASTKVWALSTGSGTKTVYARFQDNAGSLIGPFTASIVLDTAHFFQYANSVTSFSSQWSSGSWNANQVLGPPDTNGYGDISTAWAPAPKNGSAEYMEVGFATPVYADGVVIRETYGNGFVTRIDVVDTNNNPTQVWSGVDPSQPGRPVEFVATWPQTSYLVKGVKVYVNTDHDLNAWEEIDAIQLRGLSTAPNTNSGSISGTISYSGTNTGRVYVTVKTNSGTLGTSISAPGTYTIRGVPPGSYTINAFMDTLNLGAQVQVSPAGSVTFDTTGTSAGVADITLTDSAAIAPPAPKGVGVSPGDGSVLIGWDGPRVNGVELADSYDIYWGTSAAVSKSANSGSRLNVPAGIDSPALVDGLANGAALYFIIVPKSGGIEGTPSTAVGPITVGVGSGGNTVSGTVSYSGPTPTGPLYVAVVSPQSKGASGVRFTKIDNPISAQVFSVGGVPDGSYEVFALYDMNNDRLFGNGDVTNTEGKAPIVNLSGAGASGVNISLVSRDADVIVTTNHGKPAGGTGEWYTIEGVARGQLKRPVAVTLTGVPSASLIAVPIDVGVDKWGEFRFWNGVSARPTVGDEYTFSITYADGISESKTASVTGVSDNFPINPLISGTVSTVPTFTWEAPTGTPAGYSLWVGFDNNNLWDAWDLPGGQLSVVYNFDGRAQPLQLNTQYNWNISARDQDGNRATIHSSFIPTVADIVPPSVSTTPIDGATGVTVTSAITAVFSEPIDPTTLTDLTGFLKDGSGAPVVGAGSYDPATRTATFKPAVPLAYGSTYTATITTGVKDLAGNPLAADYSISFTTAPAPVATVIFTKLTQTYTGTPLGATVTTIPAGLPVTITYNGSIALPVAVGSYSVVATVSDPGYTGTNSGTLVIAKAAANVSLSGLAHEYDGAGKAATATTTPGGLSVVITYNGSTALPVTVGSYSVVATVSDTNYQGSASGTLTIVSSDRVAPSVKSTIPADDEKNVAADTAISVTFSEPVNPTTVLITLDNGAGGTQSYDSAGNTVTFRPSQPLAAGGYITVTVSAMDAADNAMSAYTWRFRTASLTKGVKCDDSGKLVEGVDLATTDGSATVAITAGTVLTDILGRPLTGALTMKATPTQSSTDVPGITTAVSANGQEFGSLGAAIDIVITSGTSLVTNFSQPMQVKLKLAPGYAQAGSTVAYYSNNGSVWNKEGVAVVNPDGSIDMSVGHLSVWAVAKFLPTGKIADSAATVTISDALKALQIAVGLVTPTENDLANGDVAPLVGGVRSPNGSINVGDAIILLQRSLGLITSW